jgi:hypothetical protein
MDGIMENYKWSFKIARNCEASWYEVAAPLRSRSADGKELQGCTDYSLCIYLFVVSLWRSQQLSLFVSKQCGDVMASHN